MAELKLREGAVEWREVEGQIVALDLGASEYLAVNRSGAAIWPALIAGATREELAARLAGSYDLDQAAAARDVDEFIEQLAERGLLDPE